VSVVVARVLVAVVVAVLEVMTVTGAEDVRKTERSERVTVSEAVEE